MGGGRKNTDHIGGFVVGIHGADEFAAELDKAHDPYGSIMVKAIADRFAEAFAELLHHRARIEWGYETEGELTNDQLIHENYRGIRPAPGYPAQPDHTEKPILFDLLGATEATGVTLTESCAMHPGAAVCGLYFSHPESHYFVISELQKDQIEDYARRKGMSTGGSRKMARSVARICSVSRGFPLDARRIPRPASPHPIKTMKTTSIVCAAVMALHRHHPSQAAKAGPPTSRPRKNKPPNPRRTCSSTSPAPTGAAGASSSTTRSSSTMPSRTA